jgi:hypothetical protein
MSQTSKGEFKPVEKPQEQNLPGYGNPDLFAAYLR